MKCGQSQRAFIEAFLLWPHFFVVTGGWIDPPALNYDGDSGLGGCSQADRAEPLKSPPLVKGRWHIVTLTGAEKISGCLDLLRGVTALGPHVENTRFSCANLSLTFLAKPPEHKQTTGGGWGWWVGRVTLEVEQGWGLPGVACPESEEGRREWRSEKGSRSKR